MLSRWLDLGRWKRKGALRPASIRLVATAATAPRIATAFAERIEAAEGHATDSERRPKTSELISYSSLFFCE